VEPICPSSTRIGVSPTTSVEKCISATSNCVRTWKNGASEDLWRESVRTANPSPPQPPTEAPIEEGVPTILGVMKLGSTIDGMIVETAIATALLGGTMTEVTTGDMTTETGSVEEEGVAVEEEGVDVTTTETEGTTIAISSGEVSLFLISPGLPLLS
jgi:hypothetical protein